MSRIRERTVLVRTRSDEAAAFAPRFREIAMALDPTVRLSVRPYIELQRQRVLAVRLIVLALTLIIISVLLLSAAGIYSLMSFTVSQRRKEIGIRAAMGADPRQLLVNIFSLAAWQLAAIGPARRGLRIQPTQALRED